MVNDPRVEKTIICTLDELVEYAKKGMSVAEVVDYVKFYHGKTRVVHVENRLGKWTYFCMPVDDHGSPLLTVERLRLDEAQKAKQWAENAQPKRG